MGIELLDQLFTTSLSIKEQYDKYISEVEESGGLDEIYNISQNDQDSWEYDYENDDDEVKKIQSNVKQIDENVVEKKFNSNDIKPQT